MKYAKKPIAVDAEQYRGPSETHQHIGDNPDECVLKSICTKGECTVPAGSIEKGVEYYGFAHIHTLEGVQMVSIDDWIIKGVKGEFYPCKPDIFRLTYEPA